MCYSITVTADTLTVQAMLPFIINLKDGEPVSDQIIQAVRKAILTGQLSPGDRFPSVRTMSQELHISPTTAHKVVAYLKDRGLLASRPGIGMIVAVSQQPSKEERLAQLEPAILQLFKDANELGLSTDDIIQALHSLTPETSA